MFLTAGDLRRFAEMLPDDQPVTLDTRVPMDLARSGFARAVDLTEALDGLLDAKAHMMAQAA